MLDKAVRRLHRVAMRVVPDSMHLRLAHYFYSRPGGGEPEIHWVARLADPARDAVDIGANIGLYTYRLSKAARRVHAFEPHPRLFEILSASGLPNVVPHRVALSAQAGRATFFVPHAEFGQLYGWGSLVPNRCESAVAEMSIEVEMAPLDHFGLREVGFVKIDVEGHEIPVLEGAQETIASGRPAILVESDRDNRARVDALLRRHGYRARTFLELFGREGSEANLLYLPA
jgi:FkbM family methyltransferase